MTSPQERRFEILRAIVTDYVATQEPVGSKALVDRYGLGVSSATVRNDMAVLEAEGYIAQPHTSSGRVPTERGYREFVNRIAEIKPLSSSERRSILQFLEHGVDLDDVLMRSVRLLTQLTRQVAVIQYPTLVTASVRHLEIVPLTPRRLMLVLIADSGRVDQRIVELTDDVDEETAACLRTMLNRALAGKRLDLASAAAMELAEQAEPNLRGHIVTIATGLVESLVQRPQERLVVGGAANLTRNAADFEGFSGSLWSVLEALEEQVVVLKLFAAAQDPGMVMVQIGEGTDGAVFGGVGVVGPTRMDYPGTIAAVSAVARYVGEVLAER